MRLPKAVAVSLLLAVPASAAAAEPDQWSEPFRVSAPGEVVKRLFVGSYASSWTWEKDGVAGSTVNRDQAGAAPGLLPEPFPVDEAGDDVHAAYLREGRIEVHTASGDVLTVAKRLKRPRDVQFGSDFNDGMTVVWREGRKAFIATGDPGGFAKPRILARGGGIRHLDLRPYTGETAVAWERKGRIYARWRFDSGAPFSATKRLGRGRTTKIDVGFGDGELGIGWTTADRGVLVTKEEGKPLEKRTLAEGQPNGIGVQNGTVSWSANGRVERLRFSGTDRPICLVANGDGHVWDSNGEDTAYTMDGKLYVNDTLIDSGGEYRQVQQDASSIVSWINAQNEVMESRFSSGTGEPNCLS
jgi:hypothetical protein